MSATSTRPDLRRTLGSRSRLLLLLELQREHRQTAPQLAERTQLHHNTVREHLDRLIREGLVVRAPERRAQRGRPRILFSLATGVQGDTPETREQSARAVALGRTYRRVFPEDMHPPATGSAQFDVLLDHLDRAGFHPRPDAATLTIRLSCPFEPLRDEVGGDLCGLDRALVACVLGRQAGPLTAGAMSPVRSDGADCILRLDTRPPVSGGAVPGTREPAAG